MKNIFKIHPIFFFALIIVILTGKFNDFCEFMLIIMVHELGHILTALIFKWSIDKIVILPYGMITKFKNCLNKPIYQEFIILLMGPVFQICFNYFFKSKYNLFVLYINLIPIYPLDGSKFLFLFLNKFVSYYKSYILTFIISILTIIIIIFSFNNSLIVYLMIIYLSYNLFIYFKSLHKTILFFCYERYKNKYFNKKIKYLKKLNIYLMHRDKYHYFMKNKNYIEEKKILSKMFDK